MRTRLAAKPLLARPCGLPANVMLCQKPHDVGTRIARPLVGTLQAPLQGLHALDFGREGGAVVGFGGGVF
jgi:hypothetical protein